MKDGLNIGEKCRKKKLFRLEAMWLREDENKEVVCDVWKKGENATLNIACTT